MYPTIAQPAQPMPQTIGLMPERKTFDFKTNKVEQMDLQTLKRTHWEVDIEGNPQRGIFHFQCIERVEMICKKYNLNYEVEEIFAAQDNSKQMPAVGILKKEEVIHGEKAVEAHMLRKIFATVRINDFETDELTTTIVLTYHQDGIEAAIGPCVKACHNQCVLGADRRISNYGKNKVTTDQVFETIDEWLSQYEVQMNEDRERIQRMKNTIVTEQEIYTYIGLLTAIRVAHDCDDKVLSSRVPDDYPLNQSQITDFTLDVLKKMKTKPVLTAWDLYNIATEYYKPGRTTIPGVIKQNVAFSSTLDQFIRFKQPEAVVIEAVPVQ